MSDLLNFDVAALAGVREALFDCADIARCSCALFGAVIGAFLGGIHRNRQRSLIILEFVLALANLPHTLLNARERN